jgi:deoxyribose-phosphate aldolase
MQIRLDTPPAEPDALARRVLAAIDLTRLESGDSPARIETLCASADTRFGPPAAVCVYPEHVATARTALDARGLANVPVAAVANFPSGDGAAAEYEAEIAAALAAGAQEVDWVLPWRRLLADDETAVRTALRAARRASAPARLKVILESGELAHPDAIRRASLLAIDAGADFIKTSTGKVPVNATLQAAGIMLTALRDCGGGCGFKAAGGIRRVDEAAPYFRLADELLGENWAEPSRFRIGASSLLDDVLRVLGDAPGSIADSGGY